MCAAARGRLPSRHRNDNTKPATMITQPSPSLEHHQATLFQAGFLVTSNMASTRASSGHNSATTTAPPITQNQGLPREVDVGVSKKAMSANVGLMAAKKNPNR